MQTDCNWTGKEYATSQDLTIWCFTNMNYDVWESKLLIYLLKEFIFYLLVLVTLCPVHTPDKEATIFSVLVTASWIFDEMLLTWGRTFPNNRSLRAKFSNTGSARMSFHMHIFFIRRTDVPNLYAATCGALGTAFNTRGSHVGTWRTKKGSEDIISLV